MIRRIAALAAVGGLLSACVTTVDPVVANAPLKLAFTEPVPSLESRSASGDRQAQYALSFLKKLGLRGVAQDPLGAETLRASAGAPITRTMSIYQPGVNGGAGTILNVPITDPGVSDADARRMDVCGLLLLAAQPAMGGQLCGSPAAYADLAPGAIAVRESLAVERTAVDPASVTECGQIDRLWTSAIVRFETNATAEAAAATDRIIEVCGEAPESWHARVMRALLALQTQDTDKALAVLAPVPRPAPAPIGGYSSFVYMAVQAAREDWPAYAGERDRLLNASVEALKAEPATTAAGRLETGGASVELFERVTPLNSSLTGLVVGVVRPSDPKAAPRAFWLTTSPDLLGGDKPAYFLDEYRCDGRSTYQYFPRGAERPSLDEVKRLIGEVLRGELAMTSGSSFNGPPTACQFPIFVAPGLADDSLAQARAPSVSSTPLP